MEEKRPGQRRNAAPETTLESLCEGVWKLEQGMVRSFLLVGSERALLFDTGAADVNLPAMIRAVTDLPVEVVLSHSDGDHTGALGRFPAAALHADELPRLRRGFAGTLPALRTVAGATGLSWAA